MSTLQIDIDQLRGPLSNEKATELGVVKTNELTALTTSLTELVDAKEQGYQLIGSVIVATEAPFDLSSTTAEIDGVNIPEEASVFFFGQADPKANGAYQWVGGAWTRDQRFDEGSEIKTGNFFIVDQGTFAHDRIVVTSTGTGSKKAHVIGTDDIVVEAKRRTITTITPMTESGLMTKEVLDTDNAGGEATGYVLQKDYDQIPYIFIGVTPMLTGYGTGAMAFFSNDGGVTAKQPRAFKIGDELFVDASQTKVAFPSARLVQLAGFKGQNGQLLPEVPDAPSVQNVQNNYSGATIILRNPDGSPVLWNGDPVSRFTTIINIAPNETKLLQNNVKDLVDYRAFSEVSTGVKSDEEFRDGIIKVYQAGGNILAESKATQNRKITVTLEFTLVG